MFEIWTSKSNTTHGFTKTHKNKIVENMRLIHLLYHLIQYSKQTLKSAKFQFINAKISIITKKDTFFNVCKTKDNPQNFSFIFFEIKAKKILIARPHFMPSLKNEN